MQNPFKGFETRTILAFLITSFAIVGTSAVSITIVLSKTDNIERRATLVLSSTLPLFGTWVGTVLAFYFAKDNFKEASDSTQRFAELSLQSNSNSNNLQSILVEAAMTPKDKMYFIKEISTTTIRSILNDFDNKKLRRVPVLNPDDTIIEVVYYEDLSGYINLKTTIATAEAATATAEEKATAEAAVEAAQRAAEEKATPATAATPAVATPAVATPADEVAVDAAAKAAKAKAKAVDAKIAISNIDGLKIDDYLKSSEPRRITPVAFIVPKANLAFARESMKLISPNCRDVIITEDGTKGSKVIGYLTNTDIEKLSKV